MMTSGARAITCSLVTMRSFARPASASSGKIGSPPAISTSSSVQRMPLINGSYHSSKKTFGRRGSAAARSRMSSRSRSSCVGERVALLRHADDAGEHADHLQDLGDAALIEGEDRVAALDEVVGDVGLQIGEREDEVRLQRLDLLVARVQERRDLRLLTRLRRTHGVAGDADDTIALAEQIQRLGGFFGEADDALGNIQRQPRGHEGHEGHEDNVRGNLPATLPSGLCVCSSVQFELFHHPHRPAGAEVDHEIASAVAVEVCSRERFRVSLSRRDQLHSVPYPDAVSRQSR